MSETDLTDYTDIKRRVTHPKDVIHERTSSQAKLNKLYVIKAI
jgi:hypothetical protein